MKNIYDYTLIELQAILIADGYKKYQAIQIFDWLYKKRVITFDDMHNLSKPFTSYLKQHFQIQSLTLITKLEGKDTNKYLCGLVDGNNIEAVLMKHDYGNSLCV